MPTLYLTNREKEVLNYAISSEKEFLKNVFKEKWFDTINTTLKLNPSRIVRKEKEIALISLRKTFINPNEDLFPLSDYELLFITHEERQRLKNIDEAIVLINKIEEKKPSNGTFEARFNKIQKLFPIKKVYYNQTSDGKIYKMGLSNSKGVGLKFEVGGTPLADIVFSKMGNINFKYSATLEEFLNFQNLSGHEPIQENHKRAIKLLRKSKEIEQNGKGI